MSGLSGLILVVIFAVLMLGFAALSRRAGRQPVFRRIEAFALLPQEVSHAVEAGKSVHFSLGSGGINGPEAAATYVGLAMLARIAEMAASSDRPPVVTTGNGATAILAQDTLRAVYLRQEGRGEYEPTAAQMVGATPLSYAAGAMVVAGDEAASLTVLAGSFREDAALVAHAGIGSQAYVLAGTDSPQAQAMFYAVANHPLIGEELYAGGAYLNAGRLHSASLQAEDAARWLIVVALLAGTVLKALGAL